MPVFDQSSNLTLYRDTEVVAHFVGLNYLTPAERELFDTYIRPGCALLDLGVGGGRTTEYLSHIASHYVGVDYSEGMVLACRDKFPGLQFEVADAAELSLFPDNSFDAIVFSFNGIDYLVPDEKRHRCLRECHRLLKPGGKFIFSVHNPRSLILGWSWDWSALRARANKLSKGIPVLSSLALAAVSIAKLGLSAWRVAVQSTPRVLRRIPTRAFWHGDGYLLDPAHGGLWTHCAVPNRVIAELADFQFKFLQVLPENHPHKSRIWRTRWYYYAFSKT
jgi:SAM-dependent methyltransferase